MFCEEELSLQAPPPGDKDQELFRDDLLKATMSVRGSANEAVETMDSEDGAGMLRWFASEEARLVYMGPMPCVEAKCFEAMNRAQG